MIEIALAMAIIAFGMTSILGLFPVGLNACRNSVAENCAADSVEQFSSYLKGYAGASKVNFQTLLGTDATSGYYTETNPMTVPATVAAVKTATTNFLNTLPAGVTPISNGWTIFQSAAANNVYFAVSGPGDYSTINVVKFPTVDFAAMIIVWKSPLSFYYPNGAAWTPYTDNYSMGAGLNVEISWPLAVDYNARQKRTFYIEITKPQQ